VLLKLTRVPIRDDVDASSIPADIVDKSSLLSVP
jgi:hypothetical protein